MKSLFIALLIILLLGVSAFVLYQNGVLNLDKFKSLNGKNNTANSLKKDTDLTTYSNEDWKFSFEYPSGWTLNVTPKDEWKLGRQLITLYDPITAKSDAYKNSIIEGVTMSVTIHSLEKIILKTFSEMLVEQGAILSDYSVNNVNGKITQKMESDVKNSYQKIFYFDKNNYIYVLNFIWSKDVPDGEEKLDKILSSFKLTN